MLARKYTYGSMPLAPGPVGRGVASAAVSTSSISTSDASSRSGGPSGGVVKSMTIALAMESALGDVSVDVSYGWESGVAVASVGGYGWN